MLALPPTPSMSWPKVTSTLANTFVEAVGLKKFTPQPVVLHDDVAVIADRERVHTVARCARMPIPPEEVRAPLLLR